MLVFFFVDKTMLVFWFVHGIILLNFRIRIRLRTNLFNLFNSCGIYIGITHVGGDALESVPAGDAIFIKVSLSLLISSTYLSPKYFTTLAL